MATKSRPRRRPGKTKPMTKCERKAAHRKAQTKYVAKDPAGQRSRVKKSEAKHPGKVKARKKSAQSKKSSPSSGKATIGRPRKAC